MRSIFLNCSLNSLSDCILVVLFCSYTCPFGHASTRLSPLARLWLSFPPQQASSFASILHVFTIDFNALAAVGICLRTHILHVFISAAASGMPAPAKYPPDSQPADPPTAPSAHMSGLHRRFRSLVPVCFRR